LRIPKVKPDITALISKTIIIPPEIKVIMPIPLRMYKVMKPIRDIENILSSIDYIYFELNTKLNKF